MQERTILKQAKFQIFPCDLCGSDNAVELPHVRHYTDDQPIHVCKKCGLVYVRERRAIQEVAKTWNEEFEEGIYTARIPALFARQVYVADTINVHLKIRSKHLCDIGTGEGQFLNIAAEHYGARVFGTDASSKNCKALKVKGFECFEGTVEEFANSKEFNRKRFDIVTIMWTLECCASPNNMMSAARRILNEGGHIVIATGSRIMVPFKKPLQLFFRPNFQDKNSVHFSARTLSGFLQKYGFEVTFTNRYLDTDVLCVIGKKRKKSIKPEKFTAEKLGDSKDDFVKIIDFFDRWHRESLYYR